MFTTSSDIANIHPIPHPLTCVAGVQDCEDHEDLQAGPEVGGSPVHGVHGEEQLAGPLPPRLPHHDRDDGLREPRVLHRDGRGGHRLLLDPPGDVVGGADTHLAGIRRLPRADDPRQAVRVDVRRVRGPRARPPHPHRRGQLRGLLQGAEAGAGRCIFCCTDLDIMNFSDRGQGAEAGRRQEAGGGGGRGCQGGQRGPHRHHLRALQHELGGLGGCGLR